MQSKPWDELAPTPGVTHSPGIDAEDVERAEAALGWPLPTALRDLYLATDGLRDDDAQLQVIWSLEELVEMAPSAWCTELSAAGLVAFGTDGAGTSFCLRRDGSPTVLAWYPIDGEERRRRQPRRLLDHVDCGRRSRHVTDRAELVDLVEGSACEQPDRAVKQVGSERSSSGRRRPDLK